MSLRRNFRGCRSPHGLVVAVVDVRLSWWLVWETAVVTAVKRRHDLRGRNGWSRWLYPPATGQNSGQCARWTDLCGGRSEGLWDLRFLLSFFYLFFFFFWKRRWSKEEISGFWGYISVIESLFRLFVHEDVSFIWTFLNLLKREHLKEFLFLISGSLSDFI